VHSTGEKEQPGAIVFISFDPASRLKVLRAGTNKRFWKKMGSIVQTIMRRIRIGAMAKAKKEEEKIQRMGKRRRGRDLLMHPHLRILGSSI
jgi:hypothetical protein